MRFSLAAAAFFSFGLLAAAVPAPQTPAPLNTVVALVGPLAPGPPAPASAKVSRGNLPEIDEDVDRVGRILAPDCSGPCDHHGGGSSDDEWLEVIADIQVIIGDIRASSLFSLFHSVLYH